MISSLSLSIFLLFLCHVCAIHLLSPKGRRIPLNDVKHYLPNVNTALLHTHLYDLDSSLTLHGHSRTIHFNTSTVTKTRIVPPTHQAVYIDGRLQSHPSPPISIHQIGGISLVLHDSGNARFVSGKDIELILVDEHRYPNLFVDVLVDSTRAQPTNTLSSTALSRDIANDSTNIRSDVAQRSSARSRVKLHAKRRRSRLVPRTSRARRRNVKSAARQHTDIVPVVRREIIPGLSCTRDSPKRIVEIAMVGDSATCAIYGSAADTRDAFNYLIFKTQRIYSMGSCIKLKVLRMDIHCSKDKDPYSADVDIKKPIDRVKENFDEKGGRFDIVAFIAAASKKNSEASSTYDGVACYKKSYNWVSSKLSDHEIHLHLTYQMGHSLGLDDERVGVMSEDESATWFSLCSFVSMRAYLRSDIGKCIAREALSDEDWESRTKCAESVKKTRDLSSKKVGSVPGLLVNGKRRNAEVKVEINEGYVYTDVSMPKDIDRYKGRDIKYMLYGLTVTVEYGDAGGKMDWDHSEDNHDKTISIPESEINMPKGVQSCCGTPLIINVQITAYGYYANSKYEYVDGLYAPSSNTFRIPTSCK